MKLSIKIPISYTILIAIFGAAFILLTSIMVEDSMRKEEEKHFKNFTKSLALNSANAIVLKDYAALRIFADNTAQDEHVHYVIILDEKGSILSHTRHELEGKALDDPVSIMAAATNDLLMQAVGSDILDVTAPLMIAGKKWGAVRIRLFPA